MIKKETGQLILDLTKQLDSNLKIFSSDEYSDPPFNCTEWCSIKQNGYRVSRIELGTQTGTHIDAPAHFHPGGATLDAILGKSLMGVYFLVELAPTVSEQELRRQISNYRNESILFIRTPYNLSSEISLQELNLLMEIPVPLWVLAGEIILAGAAPLEFHRSIAQKGKFLVEELDCIAAKDVPKDGELFALPLRLIGTSGSPCRVMVRGDGSSD